MGEWTFHLDYSVTMTPSAEAPKIYISCRATTRLSVHWHEYEPFNQHILLINITLIPISTLVYFLLLTFITIIAFIVHITQSLIQAHSMCLHTTPALIPTTHSHPIFPIALFLVVIFLTYHIRCPPALLTDLFTFSFILSFEKEIIKLDTGCHSPVKHSNRIKKRVDLKDKNVMTNILS